MRILHLLLFLLILPPDAALAESEQITLRTGEHRVIRIPDATNIFISRRGLVNLTHDHGDRWILSALRSGFVKIKTSLQNGQEKTFLVTISRMQPLIAKTAPEGSSKTGGNMDLCDREPKASMYVVRASVEMMDHSKNQNLGFDHSATIALTRDHFELSISAEGNQNNRIHQRQIIASPMLLTRACQDAFLRTGGEDEIATLTDTGRAISAWKSHGLDLRLKVAPAENSNVKLTFTATLRSPSKGQGNYAVNDVQSVVDVPINTETLVAAMNLSSILMSQKNQQWISQIPIVGPLFTYRDDSSAITTLLLWFKINQKSVDTAPP